MTTQADTLSEARQAALDRAKALRFKRIAKVMSGELTGFGANVQKIVIDKHGRACTDGKTVWIPQHLHDDPRYNAIMQEAILAHEVAGHHRYTCFQTWNTKVVQPIQKGQEDPLLHKFVNMLEDARINHLLSQDFAGSGKRLDFTHKVMMQDHKKNTVDADEATQAFVAMMTECIVHEPHWFSNQMVVDYMDEVRPLLNNAIRQPSTSKVVKQAHRLLKIYRDTFSNEPDADNLSDDDLSPAQVEQAAAEQEVQGNNAEQVSRQRFQDMKEVEKADPSEQDAQSDEGEGDAGESSENGDAESNEADADGEGEGEGEADADADADGEGSASESGEDGEGDADADGDADGEGEVSESGEDGDADGDTQESEGGIGAGNEDLTDDDWADLLTQIEGDMADDESVADDIEDGHAPTDTTSNNDFRVPEGINQTSDNQHEIAVIAGAKDFHQRWNLDKYSRHYNRVAKENKSLINRVAKEMQRRLKGSDPRYDTGERRGRINPKDAWKVADREQDSSRIFMQKKAEDQISGHAILLIDASGSMSGSRAQYAADAAVVFGEVFATVGIDYEVIDFCSSGNRTNMRVRKAFGADANAAEKACVASPYSGAANADGYAIEWCLNRLNKMGGNRMLVVISDGAPAGASPEGMNDAEHLIHVVANAPKAVGILGIGIAGCDTSRYYDNAITINDISRLAQESMPTIRRMLKKVVPRR